MAQLVLPNHQKRFEGHIPGAELPRTGARTNTSVTALADIVTGSE